MAYAIVFRENKITPKDQVDHIIQLKRNNEVKPNNEQKYDVKLMTN